MKTFNRNRIASFVLISLLVLLLAACDANEETPTPAPTSTSAVAAATDTPQPPTETPTPQPTEPPPTETPTPLPTETPEPTATPTQTPLEQAQAATVRIVVEGSDYLETLIGAGTGVIYDSGGLILTSAHLVEGAGLIQVSIEGREESLSAQVVGRSACDNLAVLRLLGGNFPAVSLVEEDALEEAIQIIGYTVGDEAQAAVSSALDAQTTRLTAGFADITGTIQLDTALDSGYSGAPVLTEEGLLTGLVVYTGNENQHAAVLPLSEIAPTLAQLEAGNNLNWIGVNAGPISAETAQELGIEAAPGLFVYAVNFRSPGGQADVRNGDIITEINGVDVTGEDGVELYCGVLRQQQEDEPLDIVVLRSGSRYLGQINGDPLVEEVIVEAPPETEPTNTQPPPANDNKSQLLAQMQAVDANLRSIGGRIDSLATNGCLNPPLLANASGDDPDAASPAGETEAHPGCIHSISDCQVILDQYGIVTGQPALDLTDAPPELVNGNNVLQAAIATFVDGASRLIDACRAFVNDPSIFIGQLPFALARTSINDALNILGPTYDQLQNS